MRYYSSTAQAATLTADLPAGATSMTVSGTAGFPVSHPFTLVIDPGTSAEEIVDVTASSGSTLTITRGRDGTAAQDHTTGASVRHMVTARDLREAQEHINATSNVHGATGTLVTTSATQTLTNKTIDANQNTLVNLPTSTPVATEVPEWNAVALPYASATIAGTANRPTLVTATYSIDTSSTAGVVQLDVERGTTILARARGNAGTNQAISLSATAVDFSPNGDSYRVRVTGPSGATLSGLGRNTFGVIKF